MLAEKFKADNQRRENRAEREESSSSSDCDEPVGAYMMLRKEREMYDLQDQFSHFVANRNQHSKAPEKLTSAPQEPDLPLKKETPIARERKVSEKINNWEKDMNMAANNTRKSALLGLRTLMAWISNSIPLS